jgi:hypothetical protein
VRQLRALLHGRYTFAAQRAGFRLAAAGLSAAFLPRFAPSIKRARGRGDDIRRRGGRRPRSGAPPPTAPDGFGADLLHAVAVGGVRDPAYWRRLAAAVAADGGPFGLVAALEERLADWGDAGGAARGVVYALLDRLGSPVDGAVVHADAALRADDPLGWLDLALPHEADSSARRALVADCLRLAGHDLRHLACRLDLVGQRSEAGFEPWLARLCLSYPEDRRGAVAGMFAAAFGLVV